MSDLSYMRMQIEYGPPPGVIPGVSNTLLSIVLIAITPIALVIGLIIYLKKKSKKKGNNKN